MEGRSSRAQLLLPLAHKDEPTAPTIAQLLDLDQQGQYLIHDDGLAYRLTRIDPKRVVLACVGYFDYSGTDNLILYNYVDPDPVAEVLNIQARGNDPQQLVFNFGIPRPSAFPAFTQTYRIAENSGVEDLAQHLAVSGARQFYKRLSDSHKHRNLPYDQVFRYKDLFLTINPFEGGGPVVRVRPAEAYTIPKSL